MARLPTFLCFFSLNFSTPRFLKFRRYNYNNPSVQRLECTAEGVCKVNPHGDKNGRRTYAARNASWLRRTVVSDISTTGGTHKDREKRSGLREAPLHRGPQHGLPDKGQALLCAGLLRRRRAFLPLGEIQYCYTAIQTQHTQPRKKADEKVYRKDVAAFVVFFLHQVLVCGEWEGGEDTCI